MSMKVGRYYFMSLAAGMLWLRAENPVQAARFLQATVELDGKVVLSTTLSDDGTSPGEVLWRQLEGCSWNEESLKIPADPSDASRAKLRGALVFRIRHVDRILSEAKADELSLERRGFTTNLWSIPREEVERIARANGFAIPPPPSRLRAEVLWFWAAVAVFFLLIGAWIVQKAEKVK